MRVSDLAVTAVAYVLTAVEAFKMFCDPPALALSSHTLRCTCGHDTDYHTGRTGHCLGVVDDSCHDCGRGGRRRCPCGALMVAVDLPGDLEHLERSLGFTGGTPADPQPSPADVALMIRMGWRVSEWLEMDADQLAYYRTMAP